MGLSAVEEFVPKESQSTMAQQKRRSGRIARELAIVLLGTDTSGKVFSEETKTVVLSRHGAGIVSRYALAPDEPLTLRLPGSTKEAEIRLAGQIGGEPGRHVYGVAFADPDVNFWQMEFPPPESYEQADRPAAFECSLCHTRENIEHRDIEEDVYSVNGNVLRYCERCGTSTPWKKSHCKPNPEADSVGFPNFSPPMAFGGMPAVPMFQARDTARPASSAVSTHTVPSMLPPSAYSASFADELVTAAAVIEPPVPAVTPFVSPAARTEQPAARQTDANGRRINRRKHMRVRVNFSACVRHPAHADDIVECENISKGGLCFHSRRQYAVDTLIEVAAPYSPGEAALFVVAQIRRVEPLSGGEVIRYGVAYVKPSSPGSSF